MQRLQFEKFIKNFKEIFDESVSKQLVIWLLETDIEFPEGAILLIEQYDNYSSRNHDR